MRTEVGRHAAALLSPTYLASRVGTLDGGDPLLLMVYMQAAVPSSQSAVSIVQMTGGSPLANRLSVLYLPQYRPPSP